MSTLEDIVTTESSSISQKARTGESLYARFLQLLCSVKLGVTLLCLLALACLIGMLVMQQNVDGFDRYFADLGPTRKLVYANLGFFDIYHSWYFNALLALLSLNIILASVDRFPKTWVYVSKPSVTVPIRWLREQRPSGEVNIEGSQTEVVSRIADSMERAGWGPATVTEKGSVTYVFGQKGVWNRLGAYFVHVGLLTIFGGGFLTAQLSSTGQLPMTPGKTTDLIIERVADVEKARERTKQLPFEIACLDVQQRLVRQEGPLAAHNTIDWITRFTIKDETGTHDAVVQMNRPFDYRGYRFFHSNFTPIGRAREITVNAIPADGGQIQAITIPRGGTAKLADGTAIAFSEFRGNLRLAEEDPAENTTDYKNPSAVLQVAKDGGPAETAYAVEPQMAKFPLANIPAAGYTFQLVDFEKVADQHVLTVQRDPGASVVYVGFVLLFLSLSGVFLFSHQRVWAAVEHSDGRAKVVLGGYTNRNLNTFDERFRGFENELRSGRI
jgi:cytochrome c biogenesis protein